jgi:hypothetical protein
MTRQDDLFLPMCATIRTRQAALFDTGGPTAQSLRCSECGHYLERTPSGYLACPLGHGKLIRESETDPEPADDRDWPDAA